MQQPIHVVGVDPGLVHTGVVSLHIGEFGHGAKQVRVSTYVVDGPDEIVLMRYVRNLELVRGRKPIIYIEGYRPRSNLHSDAEMVSAVRRMQSATKGTVLNNTGVKQVVKKPLMELLGVWKFSTATHHQDLRSAARIALLGMLKDEETNQLLTQVVRDHLAGNSWLVLSTP